MALEDWSRATGLDERDFDKSWLGIVPLAGGGVRVGLLSLEPIADGVELLMRVSWPHSVSGAGWST